VCLFQEVTVGNKFALEKLKTGNKRIKERKVQRESCARAAASLHRQEEQQNHESYNNRTFVFFVFRLRARHHERQDFFSQKGGYS